MNQTIFKYLHGFLANPSVTDVLLEKIIEAVKVIVSDINTQTIENVKNLHNIDVSSVMNNQNSNFLQGLTLKKFKSFVLKNCGRVLKPKKYSLGHRIEKTGENEHTTIEESLNHFSLYDTVYTVLRDENVFNAIKNESCQQNVDIFSSDLDGDHIKKKVEDVKKGKKC